MELKLFIFIHLFEIDPYIINNYQKLYQLQKKNGNFILNFSNFLIPTNSIIQFKVAGMTNDPFHIVPT